MNRRLDAFFEGIKTLQRKVLEPAYRRMNSVAETDRPSAEPQLFPKSILIFKPDEIGDAVLGLPALRELRERHPDTHLTLLCKKEVAPLYQRTMLFDEILPVGVQVRFQRFRSIDLSGVGNRSFEAAVYFRLYPASFRDFRRIPTRARVHPRDPRLRSSSPYQPLTTIWSKQQEHHSRELRKILTPFLGAPAQPLRFPAVHFTEEDRTALSLTFGNALPSRYVALHPFAKLETKRYPSWKALLDALPLRDIPLVVLGDQNEEPIDLGRNVISMQGRLSLMQSSYLLSKASAFIGNEGGPAHLAGALGIPTVVLMSGHSSANEWRPLGDAHVEQWKVHCAPCHRRYCPYQLECLTGLRPGDVAPRILSFFKARGVMA